MMNNRAHLPAGQPMQGGVADIGPGSGGGGRRGQRPHHGQPYPGNAHHYHSVSQPMYPPGYMTPYGTAPPYYIPPHYQNGAMATPTYLPYPQAGAYPRSPPSMQHFAPMVAPNPYASRPPRSPIVPQPYQPPPPPVHVPIPPHTPSSTHSHAAPSPMTPPVSQVREIRPPLPPATIAALESHLNTTAVPLVVQAAQPVQPAPPTPSESQSPSSSPMIIRPKPFIPKLPWCSVPYEEWPARTPRPRRRRRTLTSNVLERRDMQQAVLGGDKMIAASVDDTATSIDGGILTPRSVASSITLDHEHAKNAHEIQEQAPKMTCKPTQQVVTPELPRSETPSTQDQDTSTSPTTPSSGKPAQSTSGNSITVAPATTKPAMRSVVPPVVPVLPKASPKDSMPASSSGRAKVDTKLSEIATATEWLETKPAAKPIDNAPEPEKQEVPTSEAPAQAPAQAPAEATPFTPGPISAKPGSWAGLFAKSASTGGAAAAATLQTQPNGIATGGSSATAEAVGGFSQSHNSSIAEALAAYNVDAKEKPTFLQPRGLVNTGNMCYMNSVLQVLIFCTPFYNFLDHVSTKASHRFKSETPLLDAMILFMQEFKVLHPAMPVNEKFGAALTPMFLYDAIRKVPRFASMERGHQQDAQEFLGFLLETLHEECTHVMRMSSASTASTAPSSSPPSPTASSRAPVENDWFEVSHRQRTAVTRASGDSTVSTPITKIFGGQLRSELRVPGMKNSVTLEPYQSLPLDIHQAEIRTIVDALHQITRPETLTGDWDTPFGPGTQATKQVFLDPPPPILILHLKRFKYEPTGTVKTYKKVSYPLDLDIPTSVLPRHKRNESSSKIKDLLKYRLTAVVYHHGNASRGHYTVDVRCQDGEEWIRINDTCIESVSSKEVVEAGAEDDVKANQADGRREATNSAVGNRFASINGGDTGDDDGWKQAPSGKKNWSTTPTGSKSKSQQQPAPQPKTSNKDGKVAYLLFYQRM